MQERLVNECLDFSVPQFDVIRSCTHLNNKSFVDVFEATVNWEGKEEREIVELQFEDLLSSCILYKILFLQRVRKSAFECREYFAIFIFFCSCFNH